MRDFLVLFVHLPSPWSDWQGREASAPLLPNPRWSGGILWGSAVDGDRVYGPTIVNGMLFTNAGYSHHGGIIPGNVLLAFGVERRGVPPKLYS